ncbi:MAG: idi [Humibacillus sp.]|nr:idi [Humibacillus sp.]
MTTSTDEQVVLVDERGHPLGTAPKATVHGPDTPLHLGFSCYVFDDDSHVLLSRRALTKRTFPGVWTNSFCGHPAPGEPLAYAVSRRARDELGLEVGADAVRLVLPGFRYRAEMEGVVELELCPVVAVRVLRPLLSPDPSEVDDWVWEPWREVVVGVSAGRELSTWCRLQVAELAALGDPTDWPDAPAHLLPPTLLPPHTAPTDGGGPTNVGQPLDPVAARDGQ